MERIVIDAKEAILGRVAAYAAKQSLLGYTVAVVNAEQAVVSGNVRSTIKEALRFKRMGAPRKGPFYSSLPDRYVRRVIRGMLPYKTSRGREAYARVKCYLSVPASFADASLVRVPGAEAGKLPNVKRLTVGKICEELGGKRYG